MAQYEKETSSLTAAGNTDAVPAVVPSSDDSTSTGSTSVTARFYPHFTDTLYAHDHPPVKNILHELKEAIYSIPSGIKGDKLPYNAIYDNGLFILIFSILLLVLISIRKGRVLFGQIFTKERRGGGNEIKSTVTEWQLSTSLILLTFVMCGITLFYFTSLLQPGITAGTPLKPIAVASAAVAAVFIFQQVAIWIIGYIFFSAKEATEMCKKNLSFYLIPGIILILPVIVMIYFPGILAAGVLTAVIAAVLLRIVFLCSIFKFFLHNIYSLFYIILYLCAVEIIPLFVMYYCIVGVFVFL